MNETGDGRPRAPGGEDQSDRRYWDLLEAAPDGIFEVDESGRIVLLNAVAGRMFGYEREELTGQRIEILVPASAKGLHAQHRGTYWEHPKTRPMGTGRALTGVRKDGIEIPVEISLSPVNYGSTFHVIAVVRDVTERRRAEEKIQAVREQYTAELAAKNQELALRNVEVEKANRLKSEFLASMSHELRTPLHTVIGFSELLLEELEGPINAKQRRFLGHIKQDSQHLLELINDILDLSKIEAGRMELQRDEFDVREVVEEVVNSIRLAAQEKHQVIMCEVPRGLLLFADRLRYKEILINLLSNAVKFTPEHGRIEVTCVEENETLVTTVKDTGIGIAKENHSAIFETFQQLGATTKGVREGTGLGLAITKRLIEMHLGSIEVHSEPGQGAAFIVRMALDSRVTLKHRRPKRERPLVLIVEDEANASELLASYLAASQFDSAVASSAGEATQKVLDLLPDAVTLDLLIPGGKGWKVLSEIRSRPESADIPVIVVSVLDERERAMQFGANDYLIKPVSREIYIAALERQIRGHDSSRGRASAHR